MKPKIDVTQLTEKLYKLTCSYPSNPEWGDVNMVAFTGKDGILLVDTARQQSGEQLKSLVENLGEGEIRLIITTHPHFDHYGGNATLGKNATIIAHKNSKDMLLGNYFGLRGASEQDIPIITLESEISLRFNGEEVKLIPFLGHTYGDIIVHFTKSNIVCMGDLVFSDRFPFIHFARGGDIDVLVQSFKDLIHLLPADSKLIVGHGRDYTIDDLRNYREMIVETMELVRLEMNAGKSVEDIVASDLLKDWEEWSHGFIDTETWIRQIFWTGQIPIGQKSIAEPLTYIIIKKGIDAAIEEYHNLKNNQPDPYNFDENELNTLGYQLMWRDMMAEALEVFKLNVEVYPKSANLYDSLGEAYTALGNTELAIENYEKALDLNPEMPSAIEALKKLKNEKE